MTKIKMCGLSRPEDIAAANRIRPDYVGFVFFKKSIRNVTKEQAKALRALLHRDIPAVGVFVDAPVSFVAELLNEGIIDIAQLHGSEDEAYVAELRSRSDKPLIKAFRLKADEAAKNAVSSTADGKAMNSGGSADEISRILAVAENFPTDSVLLDSGAGSGMTLNWNRLKNFRRPFFLAGGLSETNVGDAIKLLHPYAVDVSSGIETDGAKDEAKMMAFAMAVRGEDMRKEENHE